MASYSGSCSAISCVTLRRKAPPTPTPPMRLLLPVAPAAARRCRALCRGLLTARDPDGAAAPCCCCCCPACVCPAGVAALVSGCAAAAAGPGWAVVGAGIAWLLPGRAGDGHPGGPTPHTSASMRASRAGGSRSSLSSRSTSSRTFDQLLRMLSPYLRWPGSHELVSHA